VWSYDPKSYAGSSAIVKASHARQIKGDDPDKRGWVWGMRPTNLTPFKKKPHNREA